MAQGGYSTTIRTNDRFVFAIPESIASEDAAPMLCAGLTVYSPMVRNDVGPGKTIGIVGIGGLGRESSRVFAPLMGCYSCTDTYQTLLSNSPKPSEPRLSYSPTLPTRRTTVSSSVPTSLFPPVRRDSQSHTSTSSTLCSPPPTPPRSHLTTCSRP